MTWYKYYIDLLKISRNTVWHWWLYLYLLLLTWLLFFSQLMTSALDKWKCYVPTHPSLLQVPTSHSHTSGLVSLSFQIPNTLLANVGFLVVLASTVKHVFSKQLFTRWFMTLHFLHTVQCVAVTGGRIPARITPALTAW